MRYVALVAAITVGLTVCWGVSQWRWYGSGFRSVGRAA